MNILPNYLDLFAGAGGLSEGLLQAGYTPIAHIEMDKAACYTLKTRVAATWLRAHNQEEEYDAYLRGEYSRENFYDLIPQKELGSVLQCELSEATLPSVFQYIDNRLGGQQLDMIVGGPPCHCLLYTSRCV